MKAKGENGGSGSASERKWQNGESGMKAAK
jgi:hypothetical protein